MYYALDYISLADATVVTFLNPFTIALAAHLLLGETYTRKEALSGGKRAALVHDRYIDQFDFSV